MRAIALHAAVVSARALAWGSFFQGPLRFLFKMGRKRSVAEKKGNRKRTWQISHLQKKLKKAKKEEEGAEKT